MLSDAELRTELLRMTDAFTDELFEYPDVATVSFTATVSFPMSRLLVDVERFPNDTDEPMSRVGMGMVYTHTAHGQPLKRSLEPQERMHLLDYYAAHHRALTDAVQAALEAQGKALIIDCHSFPSHPLPCDRDQIIPRPDFCIGTDAFHTPPELIQTVQTYLQETGHSVGLDWPYTGALVPLQFYQKDRRVESIMIEVNRGLYMEEATGRKLPSFVCIQKHIQTLLRQMSRES